MKPRKVMPWLAAVVVVVAAVVIVWFSGTHEKSHPVVVAEQALPTAVPYEFVWPDGAARGIDVPDRLYIKSIGRHVPVTPVGDLRSLSGEDMVAGLRRLKRCFFGEIWW